MKWQESIYTDGSKFFVSNPTPKKGEIISIYIRAYKDAPIDSLFLRTKINGVESVLEMEKDYVLKDLQYYKIDLAIYEDVLHYHFYIVSNGVVYYYNQYEITDCMPDETYDFKIIANYNQPKWVKNSVFYQIFPERFCNGNLNNDVKTGEFEVFGDKSIQITDWNSVPKDWEEARCLDFYGGDLEGVIEKIPYLKKLGVNAIYMNPIFAATSVHHYDCIDFFHVDDHFGGDEALARLTSELHKNDMKIILDISINHTGVHHKWFNKDGLWFDKIIGAYNNPDNEERKFYFFNEGNNYYGWMNIPTLPTLNYQSQELRNMIYKDNDSIIKKWLKPPYLIDGWRFDVADTMARKNEIQLHHEIWPEIRKSIKEENNDAYILAEDWCDCSEFLNGNEWDSAMNYYGFTRPVREFAGEQDIHNQRNKKLWTKNQLTGKNLHKRIKQHLSKLAYVIQENQFNLLDSHDCVRLHTNNISYDKYRGAVIMLFTMIGASNVYYGDEATIDGRPPHMEGCRYPMPWDSNIEESKHYSLYETLIKLKRNSEVFSGSYKVIDDSNYTFTYARFTNEECYISIISMDDMERKIVIPTKAFLKEAKPITKDVLGLDVCSYVLNDELVVITKPNTSYLIKL